MRMRNSTVRAFALPLFLILLAACNEGSPTGPRASSVLGSWEATQSVAVPECNLVFTQTLRVELERGEGSSEIFGQVTYPGLGSCSLSGHVSGNAVDLDSYRCFPFGYPCAGEPAVCTGDRHLSLCHTAIWSTLRLVFDEATANGSVRASVAAFDPLTGERLTTLATEDAVVFRRPGT
ncbi:MAG: hypothetical protein ABI689_07465 [Thermoanaerobaculia bacterium]